MGKIQSCHLHDYIEIACLYGFEICLRLKSQNIVQGNAMTTKIMPDKTEYLFLVVNDQSLQVELNDILTMQAITQNPHFDLIEFR